MTWTLAQLSHMAGGTLICPPSMQNNRIVELCTDTRKLDVSSDILSPPTLLVALKGEHYDAHDFLPQLISNPSRGKLAACMVNISWWEKKILPETTLPIVVVDDTTKALLIWGKAWSNHWQADNPSHRLIALTGSNGKTTTKEMIRAILEESIGKEKVLATQGNLNNHIGMPTTLLALRSQHRYAVIELGINHRGEMKNLAEGLSPDIALVTNAGRAHLEGLSSVAQVAEEKGELYRHLRRQPKGWAIINRNEVFQTMWEEKARGSRLKGYGHDVHTKIEPDNHFGQNVTTKYAGDLISFRLPMIGEHIAQNALAALAVAEILEIDKASVIRAMSHFKSVHGRLTVHHLPNVPSLTIIDDSYNANPESMKKAIETLSQISSVAKKQGTCRSIIALGDMGETGEGAIEFHQDLQRQVLDAMRSGDITSATVIGNHHAKAWINNEIVQQHIQLESSHSAVIERIVGWAQESLPQAVIVFIKGSRSTMMEKVVQGLMSHSAFQNPAQVSQAFPGDH